MSSKMQIDLSSYHRQYSARYKSNSQLARVITEAWFDQNMYCPACNNDSLSQYHANKPVKDFYCQKCDEAFQLKAQSGKIRDRVLDGAFRTMLKALKVNDAPSFAILVYDKSSWLLDNLMFIPNYFFTLSSIEKRKPLSKAAKRHGYVGCNINIGAIPKIAHIYAIRDQKMLSRSDVVASWNKISFMGNVRDYKARGWTSDVLKTIDNIPQREFNLADCYKFETELSGLHPENNNVRPKIRQQLQVLRDKGLLEFLGRGEYRKRY
jgi:type II restriction enzyme